MADDDRSAANRLPSRYSADGKRQRWRRLWLNHGGGGGHVDDVDADLYRDTVDRLPPLPSSVRDEGKKSERSAAAAATTAAAVVTAAGQRPDSGQAAAAATAAAPRRE